MAVQSFAINQADCVRQLNYVLPPVLRNVISFKLISKRLPSQSVFAEMQNQGALHNGREEGGMELLRQHGVW